MKSPETFAQGNTDIGNLIKPCYTNSSFVDTDNPLKTRRFYEAILINTDSIEIEHLGMKITLQSSSIPDNLHIPITLLVTHKPQTYNWCDYKSAWMNFLYLRPRHTWFAKYSPNITKTIIPR
ncbi:hypothetical protein H5410_043182 [Solanum commersonii]|uniref:Uncharacterized protein n=1 Tax=Solanum commersonii TaxID=4109 RepID=A0A9J5XZW9_SOLCO|nr:hypothetical protein H5410_043182 [Solanum commersonii]